MYEYLDPRAKQLCESIDAVEPTTPPDFLRNGILTHIAEIDQQLSNIKLNLVAFNDPNTQVHELGISIQDAVDTLAGRRDRLVKFLYESGLGDEDSADREEDYVVYEVEPAEDGSRTEILQIPLDFQSQS